MIDTIHNTGQTVGSYDLTFVPVAGPVLAIGVPIVVDYFWYGELIVFGFDIGAEPLLFGGESLQNITKNLVNSLLQRS